MKLDDVLDEFRTNLNLEADAENDVVEELRGHFAESVIAAKLRGVDEQRALEVAVEAFGVPQTTLGLRATHSGRAVLDGVVATALPVMLALAMRWLLFAPGGTSQEWSELLSRPAFGVVAGAALNVPLARFPRRRLAMAIWSFFWCISVATLALPTDRW